MDKFEVSADGKARMKPISERLVLGIIVLEDGGASEVEVHSVASGQRRHSEANAWSEGSTSRRVFVGSDLSQKRPN